MKKPSKKNQEMIRKISILKQRILRLEQSEAEHNRTKGIYLEHQKRFQDIYKLAKIGEWDWNTDTDTVTWTEELYCIAGLDSTLPAPTFAEHSAMFTPESWEALKTTVEKTRKTGEPYQLELEIIRPDGGIRWVKTFGGIKSDADGRINGICGIIQDITQSKLVEETLRANQTLLLAVIANTSDPVYVKDRQSRILMCNPALEKIAGKPASEIIGKKASEYLYDPNIGETLQDNDLLVIESGLSQNLEETIRTSGGDRIFLSNKAPYRNESGDIIGIIGISHDITERKQIEEKLRQNEELYRKTFLTSPDSIMITGLDDGKIVSVNQGFLEITGYTEEEVIGKTTLEINLWINPDDRNKVIKELKTKGMIRDKEFRFRTKNGEMYGLTSASIIELNGVPHVLNVTHNITERKKVEQDLERYQISLKDVIKERTEELEIKSMSLQETNTALKVLLKQRENDKKDIGDRFLMNLRTLVLPNIEQMKKGHLEARQRSYLEIIGSHLNEIASPLLKNLQQFSFTPREIKVAALIRQDKSTKEIAEILGLARASIDVYRKNIRKKLGLTNKKANLLLYLKALEQE